jgi:hypothetical protein
MIRLQLPSSLTNATINAQSLAGEFQPRVSGRRTRHELGEELVLGTGTATISASTFSGIIRVEQIAAGR